MIWDQLSALASAVSTIQEVGPLETDNTICVSPFPSGFSLLPRLHFYACFIVATLYRPSRDNSRPVKAAVVLFAVYVMHAALRVYNSAFALIFFYPLNQVSDGHEYSVYRLDLDQFHTFRTVLLGLFFCIFMSNVPEHRKIGKKGFTRRHFRVLRASLAFLTVTCIVGAAARFKLGRVIADALVYDGFICDYEIYGVLMDVQKVLLDWPDLFASMRSANLNLDIFVALAHAVRALYMRPAHFGDVAVDDDAGRSAAAGTRDDKSVGGGARSSVSWRGRYTPRGGFRSWVSWDNWFTLWSWVSCARSSVSWRGWYTPRGGFRPWVSWENWSTLWSWVSWPFLMINKVLQDLRIFPIIRVMISAERYYYQYGFPADLDNGYVPHWASWAATVVYLAAEAGWFASSWFFCDGGLGRSVAGREDRRDNEAKGSMA